VHALPLTGTQKFFLTATDDTVPWVERQCLAAVCLQEVRAAVLINY